MDLYTRYAKALRRKCERMLGNRADAEDVVHALFADLWQAGRTEVELPYLYRAATNRCLNLLRDARRRGELLARQDGALPAPARTRLEQQLVDAELLGRLAERLDPVSAEVLVYRYLDDLPQEEIAELMKLSRRTVGKRLKSIAAAAAALREEGRS